MSEENKAVEEEQQQEPQYTEDEQLALSKGWTDKQTFIDNGGLEDDWKTAKQFNEKGELIDSLRDLKRSLRESNEQVEALVRYNQNIESRAQQQAMDYYKAQLKEAVEMGDTDTAEQINQNMINHVQQTQPQQPQIEKQAQDFAMKHSEWFNQNSDENIAMTAYAISRDRTLRTQDPNINLDKLYNQIEEDVKRQFPHRFNKTIPAKPQPVISQTQGAKNKTTGSGRKTTLTKDQERVYQAFRKVRGESFSREGYIAGLKEIGEL